MFYSTDCYNMFNISAKSSFETIRIYWLHSTYPSNVLIILLENGFKWNNSEGCWQAPNNEKTKDAESKVIQIAQEAKEKAHGVVSESPFESIAIKDETRAFSALKTDDDYKAFLENLKADSDYIVHQNQEKWDSIQKSLNDEVLQQSIQANIESDLGF